METTVLASVAGGIARLTLNRPAQRNALTAEMLLLLAERLAEADADPQTRCIVIDGAGDHFVAGGDLNAWSATLDQTPAERGFEFKSRIAAVSPLIAILDGLRNPLIVAVKGYAVGGGLCFILAADFVVAEDSAAFIFANIRAGISPDLGLTHYLPRVVGDRMAFRLSVLGSQIDAQTAQRIGIVTDLVSPGGINAAVEALTAKLLAAPGRAAQETKRLLRASKSNTLAQQVWAEAESFSNCAQDPDFIEAVNAFTQRRAPVFGQGQAGPEAGIPPPPDRPGHPIAYEGTQ